MADPEDIAQDLGALAHSRVILQYRDASKLAAFIDALVVPLQEIEDAVVSIPPLDDLDVAGGVNLDVTADLVGQTRSLVNGDIVNDAQLRTLARARIAKNQSHSTGPDFIAAIEIIFGADTPTRLNDDIGGMTVIVQIGRLLTADDIAILKDLLPRPMGVKLFESFFDSTAYFGFADDPNAGGFADDTVHGAGHLAEDF